MQGCFNIFDVSRTVGAKSSSPRHQVEESQVMRQDWRPPWLHLHVLTPSGRWSGRWLLALISPNSVRRRVVSFRDGGGGGIDESGSRLGQICVHLQGVFLPSK